MRRLGRLTRCMLKNGYNVGQATRRAEAAYYRRSRLKLQEYVSSPRHTHRSFYSENQCLVKPKEDERRYVRMSAFI